MIFVGGGGGGGGLGGGLAHKHTHTHTYTYTHTHRHTHTHTNIHILIKSHISEFTYYIKISGKDNPKKTVRTYTNTSTHTDTHTDIHIYRERVSACRAKRGKHIAFHKNYKSASEASRIYIYMYIYTYMGRGYPPAERSEASI